MTESAASWGVQLRQWALPLFWRTVPAAARWLRLLALAAIGAVVFMLVLPLAWAWWQRRLPYSPATLATGVLMTTILLFYVVTEPIRIREGHWRRWLWYPPIWLAPVLAWGAAAAFHEFAPEQGPSGVPDWTHWWLHRLIAAALIIALALRQLPWRWYKRRSLTPASSLDWQSVHRWIRAAEQPAEADEPDLFQHRPIAARIARAVSEEHLSVALLGGLGTGKSTILNAVRTQLENATPLTIVAQFDVWAVPRPEDVPRLALNRIVTAVDRYAETIELRSLPVSYQRLAAAEPTGILSKALGIESGSDSIDELNRLTPILEALNARVVLIIEDAERAGEGFETRHLERLLWALKR